MSEEFSVAITSGEAGKSSARVQSLIRTAGIVLGGSLLLAVCSHVALPLYFTPIPLTLQTFAVLLLGLLLSPRLAAATVITYLAEGAIGLPVFAPIPALPGIAHLFGPTGGYLLAYPLAAALTGILWRLLRRGAIGAAISGAAGSAVILACGALWLSIATHAAAQTVLASAVLPFVPGDLLKITAAALVASGIQRYRRRNN